MPPFGLDQSAQSVYRFILGREGCTIKEVVETLDIPADEVLAIVDRLVELCVLRRTSDSLIPGSPSIALQSLLDRQHAELLRKQHEFAATKAAVGRFIAEYDEVCGAGVRNEWERLDGIMTVQARVGVLARQTRIECLTLLPAGQQSVGNLDLRKAIDEDLLRNGAAVWTVYQDSACNNRQTLRYAEWLTATGGQVRTTPTLPTWMMLFDRTTALLPVDPELGNCSAFQVTGAGFITALVGLFEQVWASAVPFASTPCAADGPSNMERELLRLLGQGLTDEAVCKKLGLGLRTVRRMVADLMTKLDARSRFEAGANAVARSWLQPDQKAYQREKCCGDTIAELMPHARVAEHHAS
ncbi:LuxR C-terminal-related transcriptional regulator [Lentzea sp. NPDC004789]